MASYLRHEGRMRMVRRRIETTPSEQLVALRKARDRYVAMADQLKDETGAVTTRLEDRQRERDARRIANAYEKSIANMAAKMVRAGQPSRAISFFNNLGRARPIFAVAVCLFALVALAYPGLFQSLRASISAAPPAHVASPFSTSRPETPQVMRGPGIKPEDSTPSAPRAGQPRPNARRTPETLRHTAVAEQTRPLPRPAKRAAVRSKTAEDDEAGFVAKVLQPDGSLKEEYFSANAAR